MIITNGNSLTIIIMQKWWYWTSFILHKTFLNFIFLTMHLHLAIFSYDDFSTRTFLYLPILVCWQFLYLDIFSVAFLNVHIYTDYRRGSTFPSGRRTVACCFGKNLESNHFPCILVISVMKFVRFGFSTCTTHSFWFRLNGVGGNLMIKNLTWDCCRRVFVFWFILLIFISVYFTVIHVISFFFFCPRFSGRYYSSKRFIRYCIYRS